MITLTPVEVSVIIDALLNNSSDDVFAQEQRLDALEILQYEGTLPEEEE